jgi:serine/threonine protein kinase
MSQAGEQVGGRQLVRELRQGELGTVYLAERHGDHTELLVLDESITSLPERLAGLQDCARAAGAVRHPNVVRVLEVGEQGGLHFIELEHVDGESLEARLKSGPLPPLEAARLTREASSGLDAIHQASLMHRNLSPDALWVTTEGTLKIAELGLSTPAVDASVGQILGTPAWMAPEQCMGKPCDPRTDLYSLGAILYALLTGKRPFGGSSVMELMQKHIDEMAPSVHAVDPGIPQGLEQLVARMLSKAPEDRPQSAADVVRALETVEEEESPEHLASLASALGGRFQIHAKGGDGLYAATVVSGVKEAQAGDLVYLRCVPEDDAEALTRVEAEYNLLRRNAGERVARVHELTSAGRRRVLVTERLSEGSAENLAGQRLPQADALRVARGAAQALGHLHGLGIVHRGLRPRALLLGEGGALKVTDLSVAQHDTTPPVAPGFLVGTPAYMAPEQCSGEEGVIGPQADLYALGVTLYELVTGSQPFVGDTVPTVLLQHLQVPPAPPHLAAPSLSVGFSNVILGLLAKNPSFRYASAEELLADLRAVEGGETPPLRPGINAPYGQSAKNPCLFLFITAVVFTLILVAAAVAQAAAKGG